MFDIERGQLEAEIVRLRAIIEAQAAKLAAQAELIVELRSRLEELQAQFGKDSANSSLPPSRDRTGRRQRRAAEAKRRREERKALGQAGRKPGKQPGAPGSTLTRREPDRTERHDPERCEGCGSSLADAPVVAEATRQVLEVPEPRLEAVDHVVTTKRCPCCDTLNRGTFPPEATGPVCWGPRAKATAAYLMARQHTPLERASETMADLFAAPMGEGTLAGLLCQGADALEEFMDVVAARLKEVEVVHADETSVRVGIGLGWVHTVSSRYYTHLAIEEHRGIEGIKAIGLLTEYTGTIVHDGLATYDTCELAKARHAQCHAHLSRTLGDLANHRSQTPWAQAMIALLKSAKTANHQVSPATRSLPAS